MLTRALAFLAAHPRWTALIAGGVSATGFAPLGLWQLTLIALALLLWLLENARSRRGAWLLGWLWGVGHFAVGLNWIATAFTYQAAMPAWLGWVAVVLLSLYLAVFPGLAALAAWWCASLIGPLRIGEGDHAEHGGVAQASGSADDGANPLAGAPPPASLGPLPVPGRNRLPLLLLFAAAWIVTEWLRSWVFTGFAWNPLSAIWLVHGAEGWSQRLLPLIGTYGMSALAALCGGLVVSFIDPPAATKAVEPTERQQLHTQLAVGAAFAAALAFSSFFPSRGPDFWAGRSGIPVTIVQPNIQQGDKWDPATRVENFRRLARQSIREPDAEPRLLLWPEAAVPDYLEDGYPPDWLLEPASFTRARLASLLGPDDLLLTGAVKLDVTPDGRDVEYARNSLFVLDAERRIRGRYDKAHLVPYGEYLPARVLLEPLGLSRLAPGATDFRHGPGPRTLDLGGFGSVGVQICYEIIFSGNVVDRANRPDFIFNPSNDAWFGAWGPPQHLAQARLRAIEEGLPVVRSTPTGISAIIAPDGRVVASIPMGEAGRIDARLPLPQEATLFARYGNILPLAFAAFLALTAIALGRRRG